MIAFNEWQRMVRVPPLVEGQLHLWRARLDLGGDEMEMARVYLSPVEQERAERFVFDVHRQRFVVAHAYLRAILGAYCGLDPRALEFGTTASGKPYLPGGQDLCFNISHSGDLFALAACRGREVGIDVEIARGEIDWRQIATGYFCAAEMTALDALTSERDAQRAGFFRIWTMKEAYLKAVGKGIAGGLDQAEVNTQPGTWDAFRALPGGEKELRHWQIAVFEPASGAFGAVVVEASPLASEVFAFEPANGPRFTV